MVEVFRSERTFKVWHYTAAYGDRLLLRSQAEANLPRIDLFVEGVRGLLLKPLYRGIVIREGTSEEEREVGNDYGVPVDGSSLLLVIGEDRMCGFIVGSPLQWHMDHGGFRDPSHFGPIPGTP